MTLMLASVTGPGEAEIALAAGADIIDLKDSAAGALGALPVETVRAAVAAVAGRRPVSAVAGEAVQPNAAREAAERMAATGVDYVKVGFFPGAEADAVAAALKPLAARTPLVAVLFGDASPDLSILPRLVGAGFAGVMLDTARKGGGRLLDHMDAPALSSFIRRARNLRLLTGLAGSLEAPDVPRLIPMKPDFLGFRAALCDGQDRSRGLDPAAVARIRALIPPEREGGGDAKIDYRLLAARGYGPDAADGLVGSDRIFVRDFVLPAQIGAYSHEKDAEQNIRLDVTAEVARTHPGAPELAHILSYDVITDGIRSILAEGHIELVETLAERVAGLVLADPRATRVTVRVEKLEVGPGGVGVEIVRERPAAPASVNPLSLRPGPGKPKIGA